jgi:ribosomal protein L40E
MAEPARGEKKTPINEAESDSSARDPLMRVELALRWGLPLASIACALVVGFTYDLGTAILVLAGGLLLGVIAILWSSVRTLSGDAPITLEEAVMLGAPSATEEQKRAVLQALKDLEYERSVGKVSDADYEELRQRYREEGKRLLRAVDEDLAPLRAKANAYITERLGRSAGPAPTESTAKTYRVCPSCQADNDVDAAFCKKCGGKIEAAKESQDATA